MKSSLILCSLALSFLANAIPTSLGKRAVPPGVPGFDISHYQTENYDFKSAYNNGARFVIIKVTASPSLIPLHHPHPQAPESRHQFTNQPTTTCSSHSPSQTKPPQKLTLPHPGHRRHHNHRRLLLFPLYGRHIRRPNPGRLPLRAPQLRQRLHTSKLLPRARRRLVRRRHNPAGDA